MLANYFEKNTPGAAFGGALRALQRPEEGVFFQNSLKTYPYFQNSLKICQSMFFKAANSRFSKFQGLSRDARSHW